ncbi:unnamed protein product, partial [Brassica rapa]
ETIPTDLIIDILSKLPMKSLARCRCVSKLWASIVDLPCTTELFTTRASAHPQLLFVYRQKYKLVFLSLPQPQNLDKNSPPVAVKHLSCIPFRGSSCYVSGHVQGLVSLRVIHKRMSLQIICNPSTGQALTLPKIKSRSFIFRVRSILGYDPIDNQFKVLSLSGYSKITPLDQQHQVLTLGTQELKWRTIKCSTPQHSFKHGICINGVLYCPVRAPGRNHMIGCFHVRSEKFTFIKVKTTFIKAVFHGTLINYNGKLGSLVSGGSRFADGASRSFQLLVIGDFEKQEWSTHNYVLPRLWKNLVGRAVLRLVGFVGTNEIVFSHPSQVIYYNIEKRTILKVAIQGTEAPQYNFVITFLNHMEDLKFTHAFK